MRDRTAEDMELLDCIWHRAYGCMYKTAYRVLWNHDEAEDAVMDGIERIARHLDKFRHLSPDDTCALSVIYARNIAIDRYRRRRKEPFPMELYIEEPDETVSVEDTAVGEAMTDMICALLETMPVGLRDVLNLHMHYGYSDREIGEILGIRPGTVRTRLSRARVWLRARLQEKGVEIHG